MTIKISTRAMNAGVLAVTSLIDTGSANPSGYIEIRTAPRPVDPQQAASGTLLATIVASNPSFQLPFNGLQTTNSLSNDISADNSGLAAWFRFYDRDGNAVFDGDVSPTGGTGDIQFDNVNFTAGSVISLSSLTVQMPQHI